ncbi:MAG: RNA polymerase sigma factor [Acidimicrobiales bacterium]
MEHSSDEVERWSECLAGTGQAFAALFDMHRGRVYRYGRRLGTIAQDAEDVAAGAFLELWRRLTSVRLVDGSVLPWLLITTSNLSRNTTRSLRRYRAFIRSLPRSETARGAGEVAEARLEEAQSARNVRVALRSLSKPDAALIAMTAFEGLSPAEAAAALGIAEGAARTRLHRARARVASALGGSGEDILATRKEKESR